MDTLRTHLANALATLRYPIRSPEELAHDLARRHVRSFCDGTSCLGVGAVLRLLHPRDFLFTNAQQIADPVATKADPTAADASAQGSTIH